MTVLKILLNQSFPNIKIRLVNILFVRLDDSIFFGAQLLLHSMSGGSDVKSVIFR